MKRFWQACLAVLVLGGVVLVFAGLARQDARRCGRLVRMVATQDELVILLLARPDCGRVLTRPLRDSLGIDTAREASE